MNNEEKRIALRYISYILTQAKIPHLYNIREETITLRNVDMTDVLLELHFYQDEYITDLKKENIELEKEKCELLGIIQGKDTAIQDLQKENAELKEINEGYNRNRDKLIAMGFPTFKSCKEYSSKLTNLQKENATLKKQLEALSGDIPWNKLKDVSEVTKKLTEAKEQLTQAKKYLEECVYNVVSPERLRKDIEQFLKENE